MDGVFERSGAVEVLGGRLAWRAVGSGPLLLLVNGYAASAAEWEPRLLEALACSFEVVCPDNRGVGGSELEAEPGAGGPDGSPAPALTIDAMAADLEALLDSLGVERAPAVAGWSMGGFVAQRLAVRSPERVGRLVLLSTDPGGEASVPTELHAWAQLTDPTGTPREQAARLISVLFPPEAAARVDRELGDRVAAARARLSPQVRYAQEEAMAAWHLEEQPVPGADAPPVLIAHGSADVIVPPQNAAALAARWPECRVEIFAGGGHGLIAQEPERLAELIATFCDPDPG